MHWCLHMIFSGPTVIEPVQTDPCEECGRHAQCRLVSDITVCYCLPGYVGTPPDCQPDCNSNICGPNADASVRGIRCQCDCRPEYFGDPYSATGCRPECVVNSDCDPTLACRINGKCYDPCPGTCGLNAVCKVVDHNPMCTCLQRYVGDPFTGCSQEREYSMIVGPQSIIF